MTNFNQIWHTATFGKGKFTFLEMRGHVFLQLKIKTFSGTTEPVLTKLNTKHFRVKRIQVYSMKRLIFRRKNNSKIARMISAFNTWRKNSKIGKLKLCSLFGLNVFFNVLTLIRINYQCSKLNTYLLQSFFQSGDIVLSLKFH